ncbi:integrase arm-type DNA-binding domain-containing protein [Paraburkholderia aspalathi]|uniref:tyrosine-type recombinase/integrase n=1 Tax=Paraburkholderia aspalathi TaxID=1324617 RepID=UPI0038BC827E
MATAKSEFDKKLADAAAKGKAPPYKVSDSESLYLLIARSGSQTWKWDYRFNGIRKDGTYGALQKVLTLGEYSAVSLKQARDRRDDAAALLKSGIDPAEHEKQKLAAAQAEKVNTLWPVVLEWLDERRKEWSEYYHWQAVRFLTKYVKPGLGQMPVREITVPDVRALLKSIADREKLGLTKAQLKARGESKATGAPHVAIRVRHHLLDIFGHAMETGKADTNPVLFLKSSKVIKKGKTRHNAKLQPEQLRGLLLKLEQGGGTLRTRIGLKLLLLTMCRTGELRKARWPEFNLDKGLWDIPADRMKMGEAHTVPLSAQAVALLRELRKISPPPSHGPDWLFPNMKDASRPGDANTFNHALIRLGFTGDGDDSPWFRCHGSRGTSSTMLNGMLKYPAPVIEAALAHAVPGVKGVYDGAEYLDQRRTMAQEWADHLDNLTTANAA